MYNKDFIKEILLTSPFRRYGSEKKIFTSSKSASLLWRLCLTLEFSLSESWARSITWDELRSMVDWEQAGGLLAVFLPFFLVAMGVFCDSVSDSQGTFLRFVGGLLLLMLTGGLFGWPIERLESEEGWIIPGLFTGVVTREVLRFWPSDTSLPYPAGWAEGDWVDRWGMLSCGVERWSVERFLITWKEGTVEVECWTNLNGRDFRGEALNDDWDLEWQGLRGVWNGFCDGSRDYRGGVFYPLDIEVECCILWKG